MLSALFWFAGAIAGGGGLIYVAAMFVPSVAVLLKATLDFARSTIGALIILATAAFLLAAWMWVAGDLHGANTTRAAWRADNAAKAVEARRIIAENKLAAQIDADRRIGENDAAAATLAEKVRRYETEIADRPACRLAADDVARLQALRAGGGIGRGR